MLFFGGRGVWINISFRFVGGFVFVSTCGCVFVFGFVFVVLARFCFILNFLGELLFGGLVFIYLVSVPAFGVDFVCSCCALCLACFCFRFLCG